MDTHITHAKEYTLELLPSWKNITYSGLEFYNIAEKIDLTKEYKSAQKYFIRTLFVIEKNGWMNFSN